MLAKADQLDDERRAELRAATPTRVLVSAVTGEGIEALVAARSRTSSRSTLRRGRAADPLRRGRRGSPSCTRSPATSSARRRPTASGCWRGCPATVAARYQRVRAQPARTALTLQVAAARRPRAAAHARLPRRRRARPVRARAGRARRRASARRSAPGSRSRSPTGRPGLVLPRSGLAARHGISLVNAPGPDRRRLPRRDPRAAAQHRPRRGRSRSAPATGSPSLCWSACRRPTVVEVEELALSERGAGGFGSAAAEAPGRDAHPPVEARLDWQDPAVGLQELLGDRRRILV